MKVAAPTTVPESSTPWEPNGRTLAIAMCQLRNGDTDSALAAIERGMEISLRIGDRASEFFAAVMHHDDQIRRSFLPGAAALLGVAAV